MKRTTWITLFALTGALLCQPGLAAAQTITFQATGTFSAVDRAGFESLAGRPFSLTFTLDRSTLSASVPAGFVTFYESTALGQGVTGIIDGIGVAPDPAAISPVTGVPGQTAGFNVHDEENATPGLDRVFGYSYIASSHPALAGPTSVNLGLYSTGNPLSSTAIPDAFDLGQWTPFVTVQRAGAEPGYIAGELSSFTASPTSDASAVPEPGALALFLPALGLVADLKRTRRLDREVGCADVAE